MFSGEVEISDRQGDHCLVVFQLLREAIGSPRHAPNRHPDVQVVSLDAARAEIVHVEVSGKDFLGAVRNADGMAEMRGELGRALAPGMPRAVFPGDPWGIKMPTSRRISFHAFVVLGAINGFRNLFRVGLATRFVRT